MESTNSTPQRPREEFPIQLLQPQPQYQGPVEEQAQVDPASVAFTQSPQPLEDDAIAYRYQQVEILPEPDRMPVWEKMLIAFVSSYTICEGIKGVLVVLDGIGF